MRWLRSAFSVLLLSGLLALGFPATAIADSMSLAGGANIAIHNVAYEANGETMIERLGNLDMNPNGPLLFNKLVTPVIRTYTLIGFDSSSTLATSSSGSGTTSGNGTISATNSESGTVTGTGSENVDGEYANPNAQWLGDYMPYESYSTSSYYEATTSTGYISGSTTTNLNNTYSGAATGVVNGSGSGNASSETFWSLKGTDGSYLALDSRNKSITYRITYAAMSDMLEGTAIDAPATFSLFKWRDSNGVIHDGQLSAASQSVIVTALNSTRYNCAKLDGHFIAPVDFRYIHVLGRISFINTEPVNVTEIMFPYPMDCYINWDYTYSNKTDATIIDSTEQQTYDIGQQTQSQTNQLKDTTGSDSIASGAVDSARSWYNRLGFISQIGDLGTRFASSISSGQAVNSIQFPELKFQQYTLLEAQNVQLSGWLPADIENRIKDFATLLFGIVWAKSMYAWIDLIFHGKMRESMSEEEYELQGIDRMHWTDI